MYSLEQQGFLHSSARHKPILLFLRYLLCVLVAFFMLVPIFVVFNGGFKTNGELLDSPFSLPSVWHWETYGSILTQSAFWQAIENSSITTVATIALLLVVCCPAAFVFARLTF